MAYRLCQSQHALSGQPTYPGRLCGQQHTLGGSKSPCGQPQMGLEASPLVRAYRRVWHFIPWVMRRALSVAVILRVSMYFIRMTAQQVDWLFVSMARAMCRSVILPCLCRMSGDATER